MFGGWSADRLVTVACASYDPNTFRYCDQSQYNAPFRSDVKFAGSYPIVWGLQIGASLQHDVDLRPRAFHRFVLGHQRVLHADVLSEEHKREYQQNDNDDYRD